MSDKEFSLDVHMPGMPDTSTCINTDCDVFMFVDRLDCPACGEQAIYKVLDLRYFVQRKPV